MATPAPKRRLTRDDWTSAALEAIAVGGVAAVTMERLAKTLGATRGSFYWHFKDRDELIEVALGQWEREHTTDVIPRAEAFSDPVERLRFLFREAYERPADPIEIALAWNADEPHVAPAVARVTRARLDFLHRIFTELGLPDGRPALAPGSPTASTSAITNSVATPTCTNSGQPHSTASSSS